MKLTYTPLALALAGGLAVTGFATDASAVTIEAVGTPNTTDVPSPGDLGTAQSSDSAFGDTGTPAGGTNALVGFASNTRRAVAEFDISGITADINDAQQIILTFIRDSGGSDTSSTSGTISAANDFTIIGRALSANENGDIDNDDFGSAGVLLTETFQASSIARGDSISFDVTSFVKADVGQTFTGFRLEGTNRAVGAGQAFIDFGEATLTTVIPEPASMALLGLGGLLLLPRRKRA